MAWRDVIVVSLLPCSRYWKSPAGRAPRYSVTVTAHGGEHEAFTVVAVFSVSDCLPCRSGRRNIAEPVPVHLIEPVLSSVMSALVRVFKNKWVAPPKAVREDYSGKTIIVTGATSGIGKEAVYQFAALGAAKVIVTARDLQKGAKVKADLTARLGRDDQLEVWELDMMDYGSVAAFAKRAAQLDHLDVVVLNAGVRRRPYVLSCYGWEEDVQVNTLSTTLLAILLLPKLKASKQLTGRTAVLEVVNSGLYQNAVVPTSVQQESSVLQYYNKQGNFSEGSRYKFSKLFLMYAINHLADEIGSGDVIITSICPGWVKTHLGEPSPMHAAHKRQGLTVCAYSRA